MAVVPVATIQHRRPQDGLGRGHPHRLQLGAHRNVRRDGVDGRTEAATGQVQIALHRYDGTRAFGAELPVIMS